ncbi:MAG: SUMF1/EgtB/PvdO family nonheme iron enzyme, partial [Bacteroidales bacterium]|nr:SUMF1/EgtB/PvdO family nonheme iron enzyme [Bacteroidales bacterium]
MTGVNMKKLFFYLLFASILSSCSNSGNGELIGVQDRPAFYQAAPYGMVFIPLGSFTMGSSDQDVPFAHVHEPKTVSVSSFYMDETEITNNEYRQFVSWVRDSIAREYLGQVFPEEYMITEDPVTLEPIDPPHLNWETELDWNSDDQTVRDELEQMYLPTHERFYRKKQIDSRKLIYEFYWIDLQAAAKKQYSRNNMGELQSDDDLPSVHGGFANRPQGFKDRSVYIRQENINIYPDT